MKAFLSNEISLIDGSTKSRSKVIAGPGEVGVERIPNPYGHQAPWLVLAGTKIGMVEDGWLNKPGVVIRE